MGQGQRTGPAAMGRGETGKPTLGARVPLMCRQTQNMELPIEQLRYSLALVLALAQRQSCQGSLARSPSPAKGSRFSSHWAAGANLKAEIPLCPCASPETTKRADLPLRQSLCIPPCLGPARSRPRRLKPSVNGWKPMARVCSSGNASSPGTDWDNCLQQNHSKGDGTV